MTTKTFTPLTSKDKDFKVSTNSDIVCQKKRHFEYLADRILNWTDEDEDEMLIVDVATIYRKFFKLWKCLENKGEVAFIIGIVSGYCSIESLADVFKEYKFKTVISDYI